jgi:hypothetical protein
MYLLSTARLIGRLQKGTTYVKELQDMADAEEWFATSVRVSRRTQRVEKIPVRAICAPELDLKHPNSDQNTTKFGL